MESNQRMNTRLTTKLKQFSVKWKRSRVIEVNKTKLSEAVAKLSRAGGDPNKFDATLDEVCSAADRRVQDILDRQVMDVETINKPTKLKLKYEESTLHEIKNKLLHVQAYRHRTETTANVVKRLRAMQIGAWMITMMRDSGSFGNPRLWLALKAAYDDLAIKEGTFDQWLNILENELTKYDH